MKTNLIFWLISLLSISGYLWYYIPRFGMAQSISKSYYLIPFRPLLAIVLWAFAVPLMFVVNSLLFYIAGAAIAAVGLATNFLGDDGKKGTADDNKLTYFVHMAGSIGGVVLTHIAFGVVFSMWYVSGPALALIGLSFWGVIKIKNHIFWIEVFTIYLTLIEVFFLKIL